MAVCRTCTKESDNFKLLHSVGLILGQLTTLAEMLDFCTGLKCPDDEQHLPEQMCILCVQKLAKCYQFKQMVMEADQSLRKGNARLDEIFSKDEFEETKCTYTEVELLEENTEYTAHMLDEDEEVVVEECFLEHDEEESAQVEAQSETEEDITTHVNNDGENVRSPSACSEIQFQTENFEYSDVNVTVDDDDVDFSANEHQLNDLRDEGSDELTKDISTNSDLADLDEDEYAKCSDADEVNEHELISEHNDIDELSDCDNKCPVCHKVLKNRKSYNLHIKRHDPYNPKACEYCGKVYRQAETLQRHLLSHTGEKPMECQVCGRRFRFQSNYNAHMRQHTGERPFKCSYCGKSFGTRKHMKRHELVHLSNEYPCDICGKSFSQARYLDMHKLRHTGDKPYQCQLCGKSVAQQGYLKRHMLTHTGEKPYQCDMCEKNFRDAKTLKIHKLHHAGIKPFECPYCEKNFSTSRQQKIHTMIHTGETPHVCEICNKSYRVARSLQRHMLVHTGERNHICEVCGFKFRFESNLIAHRRLHTRDDAKCPYCEKSFRTEKQLERHLTQRHHNSKSQTSSENGDSVTSSLKTTRSTTTTPAAAKKKVQKEYINQKLSKSNLVELY